MKRIKASLILVMFLMLAMLSMPIAGTGIAATDNPSTGSTGYELIILHTPGAYTSTTTPVKFKVPWPYRVMSISTYVGTGNTAGTPTYTIDVKQGSTSLLSTPIAIATTSIGVVVDGVLAASPDIDDEATVSLIFTLGGSTPSISNVTTILGVKRQ